MTPKTCPKCGRPLEEGQLCPVCALQLAAGPTNALAADWSGVGNEPQTFESVPDIETIRAAFPQLEIIESIGRGGMGCVFKARQPKLDRFVALKILSTDLEAKPGFAERFAQEGKLLARLNHPNIVAIYDFGESEGLYYLMMEFVDGVNLRQAMREERFTPEQAIAIVPKICDALQYAHEEGVLHRDIKPENILLDTKGRVKIADFGIAKFYGHSLSAPVIPAQAGIQTNDVNPVSLDPRLRGGDEKNGGNKINGGNALALTHTGQILGTPSYMAPEQLDAPHRVDHRADIYSLGVVFYELLTGELPRGHFPVPSEHTPVGADIDNVVMKALHKEREKRQQSAEEFKTEVTAAHVPQTNTPKSNGESLANIRGSWDSPLVCLIAAFCLFVLSILVYNQLWAVPHREVSREVSRANNASRMIMIDVDYYRAVADRLKRAVNPTPQQKIVNQYELEAVEALSEINAKWDRRRFAEMQSAIEKVKQFVKEKSFWNRDVWLFAMGLSILLALLALLLGFTHLKRLRKTTEKRGLMQASLTVLVAPFVIATFAILFHTLVGSGIEYNPVREFWMGIGLLVLFVGMVIAYGFGLGAIIRATRMPQSSRLHPGRAHVAAILLLLSVLVPAILFNVSAIAIRTWDNHPIYDRENHQDVARRYEEQREALTNIREKILAKVAEMDNNRPSRQNSEESRAHEMERNAYSSACHPINSMETDLINRQNSRFADVESGAMARMPGISVGSIFPIVCFILPGTILGIGYVVRIRRERERPGLASALFAALTVPLILMIGGTVALILAFGFTGFLIMLTVIGLLIGTGFAVKYWLRN